MIPRSGAVRADVMLLAALASAGCPGGDTESKRFLDGANTTDSRWVVQQQPTTHRVAVVFVHGIFGDTVGTWTHASGARFFDLLNSVPGIAGQADMLAFGFVSSMFGPGSFDIQQAANRLHLRLTFHGAFEYRRLVFVAHSMGGLVVLRELLTHREVMEHVPVVVLFATPQEGADIARVASHVLNNPALSQMKLADGNGLLRTLSDEWGSAATRPHVRCAYEGLDTYGVKIVPWSSATRFCEGSPPVIHANHIDIVKPDRVGSDAVAVAATALQDYVFDKSLAARLETPDFRPEGDHFVVDLTSVAPPQPARLLNVGGSSLRYTLAEVSDPLLYLWPNDTPKELAANGREDMRIGLGFGAAATEYRFVLRTDVEPDRRVVVRVPNLPALRAQQGKLAQEVTTALEALIESAADGPRMSGAPAENQEVLDLVVRTARDAVAKAAPELPVSGHWVLTADFLNAVNWPTLAARALREAERESPAVASNAAVQTLAARTAYMSGETSVFERAPTPILSPADAGRAVRRGSNLLVGQVGVPRATVLASSLQKVPALQAYGYSLQGDAQAAAGDPDAARQSLEAAARVRPTPSLTYRLETVRRR